MSNSVSAFTKTNNAFILSKNIHKIQIIKLLPQIKKLNYEKLNYQINVIKDQFPTINVNNAPDSLKLAKNYLLGKISDDYGLS